MMRKFIASSLLDFEKKALNFSKSGLMQFLEGVSLQLLMQLVEKSSRKFFLLYQKQKFRGYFPKYYNNASL